MCRRILHVIPSLEFGADKQLALLAGGLRSDQFDVQFCVLDQRRVEQQQLAAEGISRNCMRKRWSVDPLAFARLTQHIRRLRPDLVHTWEFSGGVYGRLASRLAGVPQLVHTICSANPPEASWQWAIDGQLGRVTNRLVTHSTSVRAICVEHGLSAERFVVIPAGVSPASPSDLNRAELLRQLKMPSDARLIGVAGRLTARGRFTDLIWAADLIRVLHDNMRLLVIGDGPARPQLERFARLASDLDHVRFLGAREDLWRIMPHLDVFWHGSSVEGPSGTIMEAMSAGVPVVACDIASRRELIVDGQSGFLVPVAGRAARVRVTDRIFHDTQLARRLGAAAKARMAACFSVNAMIDRHVSLYREMLAN